MELRLQRMEIFLDAFLTHGESNTLIELIERRVKKRVPVAYLLGEAWLQGYRFNVDSRVIIPRSFIAELLKDQLAPWVADPGAVRSVLDLCTGSGCLAVITADLFANAQVGDGRAEVEREYPRVPVTWATTSAGDDMVFVVRAEDLPAQAPATRSLTA